MIDQWLVALISVVAFALFGGGYYIGLQEGESRRERLSDVHCADNDDLERRARRVA